MADLDLQKVNLSGVSPSFTAADANGDSFKNYGKTILYVKNDDAADKVVTIASKPCNFGENHDISVTVPAGEDRRIGAFPVGRFNDENHKVNVSYDAVASLTVAAIQY